MKSSLENKELKRLGKKIRQLRMERNLSQEELAHICGFDRTYISLIERGKRNIAFLNLCAFARGLKVSVSYLTENI